MIEGNADRNLLFGVLALQMDFISREALIAAVSAWILDKSRPLDEILVRQGTMSQGRRAMLEPLVHEHVKVHGDDPGRSLAAINSIEEVRADLARLDDPDIYATLERAGSGESRAEPDYATPTNSIGTTTSSGLRFRILRPHDKGGLGIVSVAIDEELRREVALKEIQLRYAHDEEKRSRFLLEAEVTGGLEHPGIVPVYGLGQYEDGRPFYAMRFIRGDSLRRSIDRFHESGSPSSDPGERALKLRELLGRFVDVCDAVAYAHSRGILHRDIKPGNVMLGPFGETLVVDWGLAKPIERPDLSIGARKAILRPTLADSSGGTVMGSALGTPAYMSPEQAEGRLDDLGPATDVYSLGATLYHLLCGKAAFQSSEVALVLHDVRHGNFPAPRRVEPAVPPALEAVCLKAMALRPEARYASALGLAEELKAWLAGEPVTAYREPWADRLARWSRRHRTACAGAASILITAVVALAIGLVLIRHEQAQTRFQAELTDRNFHKAREAADGFLTRISNDPQLAEPALQPLRKRLLEAGVSYYEDFAREGLDPGDHARLADAYARVARTEQLVGAREKALANYTNARRYGEQLVRARPGDPSAGLMLAGTLDQIGKIRLELGRLDDARKALDRALEVAARPPAGAVDADWMALQAAILVHLGDWHKKAADKGLAAESYRRAISVSEALASKAPNPARARADLAAGLTRLGAVQVESLLAAEGLESFRKARQVHEAILHESPGDVEQRNWLATLDFSIAVALMDRSDYKEAAESLTRAATEREDAISATSVVELQEELDRIYEKLSVVNRQMGRLDQAMAFAEKARKLADQLERHHPGEPRFSLAVAKGHSEIARVQALAGQGPQARQSFEKAAEVLQGRVIPRSTGVEPLQHLAGVREGIGNLGTPAVSVDEALRSHQEALAIRRKLAADHPDAPSFGNSVGHSYSNIAAVKAKAGLVAEGIADFRRACEIRKGVLAAHPDDVATRHALADSLASLGSWLAEDKQGPVALEALKEAVAQRRIVMGAAPQVPGYRDDLAGALGDLAGLQRSMGLANEAAASTIARLELRPDDPTTLRQSARELALCLPVAGLAEPELVAGLALDALRRLVAAGFDALPLLRTDKAFDPLRAREEFAAILKGLEAKGPADPATAPKAKP